MLSRVTTSIRRNVGLFTIVLAMLIGGVWVTLKVTTDHLLHGNATTAASRWARHLSASVADLEQIASGEQPSTASIAFFEGTRRSGQVYRYVIYNRDGYSQLVSDTSMTALVDLSEFSADAAKAMESGQPVVGTKEGSESNQPSYFAEAYVPVMVDGRGVAVVAAYVDQTELRDDFYEAFLIAAGSLCLLAVVAFAVPTVAWFHRTREKQHAERRIRFLAHHDALTGLANRAQLFEQLDRQLAALQPDAALAVHYIDLDRFKEINDTFGHDGGDFLLKTVAERLRSAIRRDDVIARLGGDEFVVIQIGVDGDHAVEQFAERLADTVSSPMLFRDHEFYPSMSVGVATAPKDGRTPERLLKSADLALYRSKADGRNCIRFFTPEMDEEMQARLELERIIRHAVATDRFELHYQPLFEMSGRRLTGYEALVRLPKDDGTLIPPGVFIPVAEEMRVIDKIGAWVLREACRFAATWPDYLTVAVNLSPAQFASGNISKLVATALQEAGLDPRRLELEITESLLLGNNDSVMAELRALKARGVSIVMDDFGTGYSSLSYLWRFPFDKIKIDRSFMEGFDGSERDAETVVKTIVALGRELHMRVTVEGVETAKQAAFLEDIHGDQAQGYYFGRPIPGHELAAQILSSMRACNAAGEICRMERDMPSGSK